jgi:hypothetical protein
VEVDARVADRALPGRTSRAEQVTAVLHTRIGAGYCRPGERLAQDTAAVQQRQHALDEPGRQAPGTVAKPLATNLDDAGQQPVAAHSPRRAQHPT